MAILKIARMGHPVLSRVADAVADPSSAEIKALVRDMVETMEDAPGTGLAAPQVHVSKRVVVFFVSPARAEREGGLSDGVPLTVLINPKIEPLGSRVESGWEACLSVPELAGDVPRHWAIRYSGLGLDGVEFVREAEGFHARVVQHECDHLDGILYPQRMTDLSRLVFASEMRHQVAAETTAAESTPAESTPAESTAAENGRGGLNMATGDRNQDFEARREQLLLAALPHVVFDGWTDGAIRAGAEDLGWAPVEALSAFPGGAAELVEAFSHWADHGMLVALETANQGALRLSDKVALAVRTRLELLEPHREAVRRGVAFFALPSNGPLGLKCLYRTVDAIWYAVGDRSTDYNFYTKRLLLAGVLSSTLLCWLNDRSEGYAETWAFLDRRITQVVKVGGRLGKGMKGLLDLPERLLRRRGGWQRGNAG